METTSKRLKVLDGALSSLNGAIGTLDRTRNTTCVKPAKDAFDSARILLTKIRVCFLPARVGRLMTNVPRIQ